MRYGVEISHQRPIREKWFWLLRVGCGLEMYVPRRPRQTKCAFPRATSLECALPGSPTRRNVHPKGCRLEMCIPRRPSQTKCAFPSSLVVVIVAVYTENQRPASPVINAFAVMSKHS